MSGESAGRVPSLDGARFCIVLAIVIGHWLPAYVGFSDFANQIRQLVLEAAVSWFFVLSGFVIHYRYYDMAARGITTKQFLIDRFARLYPLYLLLVILPIFYWAVQVFPRTGSSWAMLSFVTLTQTWWPTRINGVLLTDQFPILSTHLAWLVSNAVFFYLFYALVMRYRLSALLLSLRISALFYGAVIALCMLVQGVPQVESVLADWLSDTGDGHIDMPWLFQFSPYLRLTEFMLGAAAASRFVRLGVAERSEESAYWMLAASVGYAMAYVVLLIEQIHIAWHMQLMAPVIAFLIYGLARFPTRLSRALSAAWLVWCANLTYGLYLMHGDLITYIAFLPGMPDGLKNVVTALALFFISAELYRFYERPARRWLRDWR